MNKITKCVYEVRWASRNQQLVLQQAWQTDTMDDKGQILNREIEWRDVPVAGEDLHLHLRPRLA